MRVQILEKAAFDLRDGFHFYEGIEKGLGDYYLDTLWSDIDSLQFFGGVHTVVNGFFRQLSHKFPFSVYYEIDNKTVIVHAVFDNGFTYSFQSGS